MVQTISPGLRVSLREYESRLRQTFGSRVRELRLFGSYARGEANEDSDVDVLVLIDGLLPEEVALVAGEAAGISQRSGLALAPLPMATERFAEQQAEGRSLAMEIEDQGVRL